ncbi:DUF2637 domain-containing protein [Spirillospora sp. NPDC052269]
MSQVPFTEDRVIRVTTSASVGLLAVIAAIVSYRHMHRLALNHGESALTAALIPVSVDGMIVAASMSILSANRAGRNESCLAWTFLILGSLASLAANIAVAEPTITGRVVAAWPSFALVGAYEMLMSQLRHGRLCRGERPDPLSPQEVPGEAADEGVHVLPARGQHLQQEAWQWALARRGPDGQLPSGAEIGRAFNRSPRWGRLVKKSGDADLRCLGSSGSSAILAMDVPGRSDAPHPADP